MNPVAVTTLLPEDLQRWRTWYARDLAIEACASAYSRDELEEHYRQRSVILNEFIVRYDLIDTPRLAISDFTGIVYYEDA